MKILRHSVALVLLCTFALAQNTGAPSQQLTAQDLLGFLNQTLNWYRGFAVQQQLATESADIVFLNEAKPIAEQIVRLSFGFAHVEADQVTQSQPQQADAQQNASSTRLAELAAQADQQAKQSRAQIQELARKAEIAPPAKRASLESQIAEAQSELELAQTRAEVMRKMQDIVAGNGLPGTGGLKAQIKDLERAAPTVAATASADAAPAPSAASAPERTAAAAAPVVSTVTPVAQKHEEPSGIIGLTSDLFAQRRKLNTIDDALKDTDQLSQALRNVRAPVVARLKALTQQGNTVASQPDSTDSAVLRAQKQQLDSLTAQFKQGSEAIVPLTKQRVLLEVYKRSLTNWRGAVKNQYNADLRNLVFRLGVLAIMLVLVFSGSALWEHALRRYIQDPRRRYQLGIVRRVVLWFVVAIVVAFAFATELGSLATFAGLITAGIALALQNVILSVAGYFFLIGRYGVRIGDRVQVAGVTGEVVDIGLVRLHLLELRSAESDAQPSGRVVVFSNSVVFQPNAGVFKQIPGTNFMWHEICLTVAPEGDYQEIEKRLTSAVDAVFRDYGERMESQRRELTRSFPAARNMSLHPESRLRLTQSGLDVLIRYPVDLEKASKIDDRVTRELLDAIEQEPKLKLVGTGTPNIQPAEVAAVS